MQRCEHARAPGSRTLDIAAQALSNRSHEQGRGHARTVVRGTLAQLHARASMQGGEHSACKGTGYGYAVYTVDIAAQALNLSYVYIK